MAELAVDWSSYEPNSGSSIFMPSDYQNDFNFEWGGQSNTYSPGQQIDATDWEKDQIKAFRDATGAAFKSDDVTKQFDQYSLDNLDGMSQYDFQLNGTGDQWADMTTSDEMNRFWASAGVKAGDRESAMNYYNYYDGTQYDDAGNMTERGTGINDIEKMDLSDYKTLGNIATGAKPLDAFTKGYMEDSVADPNSETGIIIDGKKSNDVTEDDYNAMRAKTFQAFMTSAQADGALGDKPTDGQVNEDVKRIYDSANENSLYDFRPDFQKNMPQPDFVDRELGQLYLDEPTLDPDIRPRDMFSKDELMDYGIGIGDIQMVTGPNEEATPTWGIATSVDQARPFEYTSGALDNPYDVSRESFESALSLMGDDLGSIQYVNTDEQGNYTGYVEGMPWSPGATNIDLSQANQTVGDQLTNPVGNNGELTYNTDMVGSRLDSPLNLADNYDDRFVELQMRDGGYLGDSVFPGWTPTSELAKENSWNADDYRAFTEALTNENYSNAGWAGVPDGGVSPEQEAEIVSRVNSGKNDRRNQDDLIANLQGRQMIVDPYPIPGAYLDTNNAYTRRNVQLPPWQQPQAQSQLANTPEEVGQYLDNNQDWQTLMNYANQKTPRY